jgi:CHAT domain-containing protein
MLFEQYAAAENGSAGRLALAVRALDTAEQARARALADYQSLDATASGLDPALVHRRHDLYRELAARRSRLEASLDRRGIADTQSQAIRSEITVLRQELDQIDAKIGAASQAARSLPLPAVKSKSLSFERIPEGVALIEYWLGSTDCYAWVVTRAGVTMTRAGPSDRISDEAVAFHTALRDFGAVARAERLSESEKLYRAVISPIEGQISQFRTLIFAPDAALHYVPFAALHGPAGERKVYLVENHDIAVTPSIHMFLQMTSGSSPPLTRPMLLVSDPVYEPTDTRVAANTRPTIPPDPSGVGPATAQVRGSAKMEHLPRLPGAAREASAIASLLPSASVDRLDGFAANRERFLASGLERYRLIHVASHASMDPEIPQTSALILSTVNAAGSTIDCRVLAADFMGLRLNADTVVLSGCDTALGKNVAGEGLMGLQYIMIARGARSVISSLWPAIDNVTAEIMVRFYSSMLSRRTTVIAAWSAASRAMLSGPYSDPASWGAFMLTLSHVENATQSTDTRLQ